MSNNMLIVALREMMADFAILSLLAVWCSTGFLLSMTWLSNGLHNPVTISKWMLWVWFGLDGTGIEKSVDFHKVLGPLLMIAFAFLGNTLFLTLLVAMLSSDFSSIVANAATENQYRRAVVTFGGVKSDSIFAYQPPFNIVAVCLLLPIKFLVSPRWFHKINVAAIRTINAPLLLIICFYERRYLWRDGKRRLSDPSERRRLGYWGLSRFSVYSRVRAVFNDEPYGAAPDKASTKIEGQWLRSVPKSSRNSSSMARRRKRGNRVTFTDRTTFEMGGNVRQRLGNLEISSKRIEDSLSKLCEIVEQSSGRGRE